MAIRPADLQLAYLAAPQNAAQVNSAQNAPQSAQAAAQAAFAAQVQKREETIAQTEHAEGTIIRTNPDGGSAGREQQGEQQHRRGRAQSEPELPDDGEQHFIDVIA